MKSLLTIYLIVEASMSIFTFILFAVDKAKSSSEENGRIPEMTLLSAATFCGAPGALAGMYILRHKTRFDTKFHFALTAWISLAVQVAALIILAGGLI